MSKKEKVAEYRDAKKKLAELRAQYKTVAKDAFKEEMKELFDSHPQLIDFGWRQYTPYFNDGEPCVFLCGTSYPSINGYDDDYGEEPEDPSKYPELTEKEQESLSKAVRAALALYDKDDYMDLFGDHVKVLVTRKGIEVTEYSHE